MVRKPTKRKRTPELGARLKRARKKTGISQSEVARQLKCTRSSVSQWEDGTNQPRAKHLRQLARLYTESVKFLAYGDDVIIRDVRQVTYADIKNSAAARAEYAKIIATTKIKNPTLWRLETDMMEGWALNANDIVVVERAQASDDIEANRVVIALHRRKGHLIRVFFPPYLYALPLKAQPAPLKDGGDIRIIGVVVGRIVGRDNERVGEAETRHNDAARDLR